MLTNDEINNKYESGYNTLIQERDRVKLPELIRKIQDKKIIVDPNREKAEEWDDIKKSKLIESLIITFPVPQIIVWKQEDGDSYLLVDGRQRLKAIFDFYSNQLALNGLDIKHELDGCIYNELPKKLQRKLDNYSLHMINIIFDSDVSNQEMAKLLELMINRLNND